MIYLGLFVQAFLAATLLPLASEPLLLYLYSQGHDFYLLLLSAGVGNSLGSLLNYALGYFALWGFIKNYLKMDEQKVLKFKKYVEKFKSPLSFFCWLPVVGDLLAVALGLFRVSPFAFIVFMCAGKFLRYYIVLQFPVN